MLINMPVIIKILQNQLFMQYKHSLYCFVHYRINSTLGKYAVNNIVVAFYHTQYICVAAYHKMYYPFNGIAFVSVSKIKRNFIQ